MVMLGQGLGTMILAMTITGWINMARIVAWTGIAVEKSRVRNGFTNIRSNNKTYFI